MAMPLIFLIASGLCAEITSPLPGGAVDAVRKKSREEQWEDIAALVEKTHDNATRSGPVAIYDVYDQPKLPSRIFIVAQPTGKQLVESLLEGTLEPGWKNSGKYWILDQKEAVKKIARALKKKDPAEIEKIKENIERELGPSLFMVYRVHKGPQAKAAPGAPPESDMPSIPAGGEPGQTPAPKPPPAPKP